MSTSRFYKRFREAAKPIAIALGCLFLMRAGAQTQPLQLLQQDMLFNTDFKLGINWQSRAGVPLSSTNGNPAGSDGRSPTIAQQQTNGLSIAPVTPNQFQGLVSFG